MKTANITWITPSKNRRLAPDAWLRVSTNGGGKHSTQVVITIYEKAMRDLRLFAGDKIGVGFSDDGYLIFRRQTNDCGYTASPAGKDKKEREQQIGKAATTTVKVVTPIRVKARTYTKDDVLVDGDNCVWVPIELMDGQ